MIYVEKATHPFYGYAKATRMLQTVSINENLYFDLFSGLFDNFFTIQFNSYNSF